ncbi:MAG TPA: hypothetical protein VF173_08040 [Thermoanaerobaculia bacterium]|nr:hypothetical protein [Thermoanaerobaculia bacterium]
MKRSNRLALVFFLFVAVVLSGPAGAQSTDRDHPTPVKAAEINGDLDGSGHEGFYSFVAGPGELTLTVDVKSATGQALLNFELLGGNASTSLICCEFAQADGDGQSARDVKSVTLAKRQTVVLHVTVGKAGTGTYRIRLSGAVAHEE